MSGENKIVGLDELRAAAQGKLEPKHETQTVTTSDGSFTITDALDAPVVKFSATGMGTPSVAAGSVEMGSQTWNNPMVLDVPIGVVDSNSDALFLNYGGGIGSNTFVPTTGEETGNLIYYNSKQLADFFDYIDDQKTGTVTDEANSYELFTCNLPFAVEGSSTIYCSHLKNQNVSGKEGIWADGSTLYIRAQKENSGRTFEGFADRLRAIAMNCNFYDPYNPIGIESYNFQDFFIMLTASANYTKKTDRTSVVLGNGSKTLYYFKISDYLAAVQETTPNPTLMSNISVTYYLDTETNQNQNNYTNLLIDKRFNGIASLGSGAVAHFGGAIGEGALENYGGFAGGYHAKASTGGAIGAGASTIGRQGGAVGSDAKASDGGAVGYKATTSDGAAIGKSAVCKNTNDEPIDAIQLGTGTNQTLHSMKVYNTELLRPRAGTYNYGLVIPLSLITESYDAATTMEKNDFDVAIGNIVRYSITNDLIGASIGTFVKLTSNNTVSEAWEDGDVFIGQLAEVPSSGANTALVRIKGVMETEAKLGLGLQRVAFSDGTLDISANGREIFVTSSINGRVTFVV